jgi:hypothetical protein
MDDLRYRMGMEKIRKLIDWGCRVGSVDVRRVIVRVAAAADGADDIDICSAQAVMSASRSQKKQMTQL